MIDSDLFVPVEITLSAVNLPKLDVLSESDPFVILELKSPGDADFHEIGRSETVKDKANPVFQYKFRTEYRFEEIQKLRVKVYDEDEPDRDKDLSKHDYIGSAIVNLGNVVSSRGGTKELILLDKNGQEWPQESRVIITAKEVKLDTSPKSTTSPAVSPSSALSSPESKFDRGTISEVPAASAGVVSGGVAVVGGVAAVSGVVAGAGAVSGVAVGSAAAVSGVVGGAAAVSGVAGGVLAASGVVGGAAAVAGISGGAAAVSGVAGGAVAVSGVAGGVAAVSGVAGGVGAVSGGAAVAGGAVAAGGAIASGSAAAVAATASGVAAIAGVAAAGVVVAGAALAASSIASKSPLEEKKISTSAPAPVAVEKVVSSPHGSSSKPKKKKKHQQAPKKANFSMLDYILGGLQVRLMVAIDYTGSNGDVHEADSLHYQGGSEPNQYEKVIRAVGEVVCPYDSDGKIPVWGFGGKVKGEVNHCFAVTMNEDKPEVDGLAGVLRVYRESFNHVQLSGPTCFSEVIERATVLASEAYDESKQHYDILLILTDGQINDMEATLNALHQASSFPLSVIIVGVGFADFHNMTILDGDDSKHSEFRDITQFVCFRDLVDSSIEVIAKETLAEVPGQFMDFMRKHNIQPLAPLEAQVHL
eukprot:TRINITY_DN2617_c0_g1_i1.p1 TRINITY_DN2617_c0_g1~~TRINITY_DN2617_c0_g1_i1.p1  ORF type:complete len:644 (-),score=177.66 TRINITY_DN2617_c0_g1_i1:61-1992(-)